MNAAITFAGLLFIGAVAVAPVSAQETPEGLRGGDMVRLKIWREPDLSGDFQVDEHGDVVFPRIGALSVTRLSADSLKHILVRSYAPYLRDPSIDVGLFRRVNVLGAVRTPGLYLVDQTETIADLLAKAGGATAEGKPNEVDLLRRGDREPVRLKRDAMLFRSGVRSGDQLYVPTRSWFSRNSGPLVGAGITATAIIIATVLKP